MEALPKPSPVAQIKGMWARYEKYLPAGFFIGGFLFDVFTLGRIDSLFSILQQAAYLLILAVMLAQMMHEMALEKILHQRWKWYLEWRVPAMHFIFGSLLSSYTLFFFLSGSLSTSFGFLLFIVALLVGNEFPRFQGLGLSFKFALLSLCTMSYGAYLVPTLIGQSGVLVFLVSILAGVLPEIALYRLSLRWGINEMKARTQILRPALFVFIGFLLSYLIGIIPPVPLSLQYVGIYHSVQKSADGKFELSHERPWWRFWHNGDQWFYAQPGDKIVAFFRVFSPDNFKDNVRVVWSLDVPGYGWQVQDKIPIKIVGGRDEGFRGYAVKANYTTGKWRVALETSDGREIGRLGFKLDAVPESPREFRLDRQ